MSIPPPCARCGREILPGSAYLKAMGRTYHEEHFTCSSCGRNLGTTEFFIIGNDAFCKACQTTKDVPTCGQCGKMIARGSDFLRYDNTPFHMECFVCHGCQRSLSNNQFFKHQGNRYCQKCSERMRQQAVNSGGYGTSTYSTPASSSSSSYSSPSSSSGGYFGNERYSTYEPTTPAYSSSQKSTSSAVPEQSVQILETPSKRVNSGHSGDDSGLADALADLENASFEFDANFGPGGSGDRPQSVKGQVQLDDVVAMLDEMENAAVSNY